MLPWFQGHVSPCLKTCRMSAEMTSQIPTPENEKPQETDADVLKRDVIYVKTFKLLFSVAVNHVLS